MPTPPRHGRARVVFDDVLWDEDLAAATAEATHAASRARDELSRHGAPLDELRACDENARDGSSLPGCVKLYVPLPAGPWGIVFQLARDEHGVFLAVLAFGLRHPPSSRRASVYAIAHRRLHS